MWLCLESLLTWHRVHCYDYLQQMNFSKTQFSNYYCYFLVQATRRGRSQGVGPSLASGKPGLGHLSLAPPTGVSVFESFIPPHHPQVEFLVSFCQHGFKVHCLFSPSPNTGLPGWDSFSDCQPRRTQKAFLLPLLPKLFPEQPCSADFLRRMTSCSN